MEHKLQVLTVGLQFHLLVRFHVLHVGRRYHEDGFRVVRTLPFEPRERHPRQNDHNGHNGTDSPMADKALYGRNARTRRGVGRHDALPNLKKHDGRTPTNVLMLKKSTKMIIIVTYDAFKYFKASIKILLVLYMSFANTTHNTS